MKKMFVMNFKVNENDEFQAGRIFKKKIDVISFLYSEKFDCSENVHFTKEKRIEMFIEINFITFKSIEGFIFKIHEVEVYYNVI